ncbi:MAG: 3-oxoacyl-ACP synthase, partial [Bacteroidetes bacterium]
KLCFISPGAHGGSHNQYVEEPVDYGFSDAEFGELFLNQHMIDNAMYFPHMEGQFVFKLAVSKFPEVINEALQKVNLTPNDLDMVIPHQANLRISKFVQRILRLPDEKIWNNIQKYGNTTAASVPIALAEAVEAGAVKRGDLVCLAAFGSGFTWGSALLRW